ncbi:YjbQ family protein [Clostridium botulinum]|nr:YjbQ family protein [Clostridium botulinum]
MFRKVISINTKKQFTSLNEIVADFVKGESGIGMVNIFTSHTTAAIKIIENELLLLADINNCLEEMFPEDKKYMHDRIEIRDVPVNERVNGFSHMRQMFFSTSENIPVQDGKLMLGKWQTLFFIEFDPIRKREVVLTYSN